MCGGGGGGGGGVNIRHGRSKEGKWDKGPSTRSYLEEQFKTAKGRNTKRGGSKERRGKGRAEVSR